MPRHGDVLASPEDCINRRFTHLLDREIILMLYRLRNNKLSSTDIQRICRVKHLYGGEDKPYAIRSVEGRLASLVSKGDVIKANEDMPVKSARPKYLYSISNNCKEEIETYVKTPAMELSGLYDIVIVDHRKDDAVVSACEERPLKGRQATFDELIQVLLSNASRYLRQSAAHALSALHDTRTIEPLVRAMLSDEYNGVRSVAAEGLEKFGYRQEFTISLKDSDPYTRRVVAEILGRIGDVEAIDSLMDALHDSDLGVQCATANALGQIGDDRVLDALIPLLGSENESARHAAVSALRNIGGPRAIETLRNAQMNTKIENILGSHVETYPAALLDNYIRRYGKNHGLDFLGDEGKAEKK